MMLSESQERMLMVLEPGREEEARAIFEKWELDFSVCGILTDTGHMVLRHKGEIVADLPIDPLAEASPEYDLTREEYAAHINVQPLGDIAESSDIGADLLKMMASPALASRRWIWEQYDSQVSADTAPRPVAMRRSCACTAPTRAWRQPPTAPRVIVWQTRFRVAGRP